MPNLNSPSKRRSPGNRQTNDPTLRSPLRNYFSQVSSFKVQTNDLPFEDDAVGHYSPVGIFFICVSMTIPFAYLYILLILLRELCFNFPDNVYDPIKHYVPLLANVVGAMEQSSVAVETWCIIEALFYLVSKLQIYWLQSRDPLEASLSSAPMLELDERELLWNRIMDCEKDDPVTHLQGWFFDEPIDKISKYDVRDFISWSMFECRNQEHLTGEELAQLDRFMDEFEYHISIFLYGAIEDDSDENERHNVDSITRLQEDQKDDDSHLPTEGVLESVKNPEGKPVPKKSRFIDL